MNQRESGEAGFTLVELLVVLVIMPLIIGAIASAIIVSERDSGVTSARLTDSANAQITSEFYGRDVQGAQYVTTASAPQSPPVCVRVNPPLTNPTLVLGLYRPATSTIDTAPVQPLASALSVGYWLTGGPSPQVVRDACSVSPDGTPTFTNEVVISDDVLSSPVSATILPPQFANAASTGWTPTAAETTVTTPTDLSSGSLTVASTNGFQDGSVTVLAGGVAQTLSCRVTSPTTLSCTGGSGSLSAASPVTQSASISGINLTVTQPGSSYTYSLQASPRPWSSQQSVATFSGPPLGASLVMLGSPQQPVTVDDATLTVNGNANFDGGLTVGTLGSGQGHPEVTVTGALNSVGLVNCINGTVTAGGISQCNHSGDVGVSDPLARFVKPPQVDPTPLPCPAFGNGTKVADLNPGTYNCPLQVNDGTLLLEAGVYELHGGISVTNGGSIKMASATGGGAMLYLPPFISNPFKINGGSINIRPLSPAQSAEFFLGTTALAGVWLWQDADDTTQVTINNPGSITLTGTAYVPGATVVVSNQSNGDGGGGGDERNPDLNLGRLIASGLTLQPGSPDVTITGQ